MKTNNCNTSEVNSLSCQSTFIIFEPDLSFQFREDVFHSTLLARMTADKKQLQDQDQKNWYIVYADTLQSLGWLFEGFCFNRFDNRGKESTVRDAVFHFLSQLLSGKELEAMQSFLISDRKNKKKPSHFFYDSDRGQRYGKFQVGHASKMQDSVQLRLVSFYYASEEISRELFYFSRLTETIQIFGATATLVLNKKHFSELREQVIGKLAKQSKQWLEKLQIEY